MSQETRNELDKILFGLKLEAIQPALAWLYIIGDRPTECVYDSYSKTTTPCSHATIIHFAKFAHRIKIVEHGIDDDFYPLALAITNGDGTLAAANIGKPDDRAMIFAARGVYSGTNLLC